MYKRTMKIALIALFSAQAYAAGDTGTISQLYTHPNGWTSIKLDIGFPAASSERACGDPNFAGVDNTASATLKASLFMAFALGSTVTVVTSGNCQGGWFKIEALYINRSS